MSAEVTSGFCPQGVVAASLRVALLSTSEAPESRRAAQEWWVCVYGIKVDIVLFVAPFGASLVAQTVKNLPAVW